MCNCDLILLLEFYFCEAMICQIVGIIPFTIHVIQYDMIHILNDTMNWK